MEAGFSSYALGWAASPQSAVGKRLDAAGVMATAIALGYRRVQLADNVPLHELTRETRAELKRVADAAGVKIEVGARGLRKRHLARYLALAVEFGSPFVRMVIDQAGYEPEVADIIRLLRSQKRLLARAGVVLAIENHDRFKAAQLAQIIRAVDSPFLGICLDTANSLGAAEDLTTVVRTLGPYVVNVHLKDVRFRRVSWLQGFCVEGVPLGDGQIDLRWLLNRLVRFGRCHSATLEHWVPPETVFANTLRKEMAWCRRSTLQMKRLFPRSFVARR